MKLSDLTKLKTKDKKKRVGRGSGSGKGGHTTGRGHKGQKARAGSSIPAGFEGGQTPLYKRMPIIGGFKSSATKSIIGVPVFKLNVFREGSTVQPADLVEKGIIKSLGRSKVKILGGGKMEKKLVLKGFLVTGPAREKLEKAGTKIL
jgi:large subunit ribosomal protein L15